MYAHEFSLSACDQLLGNPKSGELKVQENAKPLIRFNHEKVKGLKNVHEKAHDSRFYAMIQLERAVSANTRQL